GHVLAMDAACPLQAMAKSTQPVRERVWCGGTEEADHRHRGLLRARGERPRSGCAAEQRDEFTPFQLIELHSFPASQGHVTGYRIASDQSAGSWKAPAR